MQSILVIRGGALGDFLVTLPAVRLLREEWPEARIDFLGNPRYGELGEHRFYFNAVQSLERGSLARFFVPGAELDARWTDFFSEFDLIVSYLYDPDNFFHDNLSRCLTGQIVRGTPQVESAPAARHFCQPLELLRLQPESLDSRLFLKPEDHREAQEYLRPLGKQILAFHPGSGSPAKNWTLKYWREVIANARELGYEPLLIAGEVERKNLDALTPLCRHRAVDLPLPLLAAIFSQIQAFIGHDSGITHLAAAAGAPTLALFGPTDPEIWAPPGEHVTVFHGGPTWLGLRPAAIQGVLRNLAGRS